MPGFGGLVVLLFAPYIADYLGRRHGTGKSITTRIHISSDLMQRSATCSCSWELSYNLSLLRATPRACI